MPPRPSVACASAHTAPGDTPHPTRWTAWSRDVGVRIGVHCVVVVVVVVVVVGGGGGGGGGVRL